MMRRLIAPVLAFAALALPAHAEDAYTTRIEPRAFYGATVTIEAGVRVFRPLPPTRHVIVNPNGETPLNLSLNDTRVTEESRSYNYNYNYDTPHYGARGLGGYFGGHRGNHGGHGAGHKGHYGARTVVGP